VSITILPRKTANGGLKSKKAQPTAAPKTSPPSENIWLLLRKTKEKRAQMRSISEKSFLMVSLYDKARTHFEENC
jgi:hypothetical protein